MSGNYQKFNTEEVQDNKISQETPTNGRAGSANNLFEDVKRLTQRVDLLEKKLTELSKSCPHNDKYNNKYNNV